MTRAALVVLCAFSLKSTQAQWNTTGSGTIYYNGGNVGIGTSSPFRPLHIVNRTGGPDNNLGLTGPGASVLFSADTILPLSNWAKIGLATSAGHFTPTSQSATTIKYSYPSNSTSAFINISDETGKLIKRIDIKKSNNGTMNFALGEAGVTSGVYIYALEVNGKTISNKKVVLAK